MQTLGGSGENRATARLGFAAALVAFHKWEEWVNVVLAVWLIASPFALEFASHTTVLWNHIIVGVLVGILALWTALTTPEEGITAGS